MIIKLIPIITEDGTRWEQIIIIGKPEPIRVKMNEIKLKPYWHTYLKYYAKTA